MESMSGIVFLVWVEEVAMGDVTGCGSSKGVI